VHRLCRSCESEYSKLYEVLYGRLEKCYEYYQMIPDKHSLYKMQISFYIRSVKGVLTR
jgi:hypothetical protein